MRLALELFHDFHLHGASAPEWNQRYLQISRGAMRSWLAEATFEGVHVFRKWMSERVVQQGCLPAGKICFALLNGEGFETPRMNGRELRHDNLIVLHSGDEFALQRPKGMELLAVTFESAHFLDLVEARNWSGQARRLLATPPLQADARLVQRVRRRLLSVVAQPASNDWRLLSTREDGGIAAIVFEALTDVFHDAAGARQGPGSASASFLVAECHRIMAASEQAPLSIDALCTRLRTSRRSMQNSFRQVASTTPVHYLRSLRLNAVRKRLMSTAACELSVAQAATDAGFSHLSHFADRYKELFGELPSQTKRNSESGRPGLQRGSQPMLCSGVLARASADASHFFAEDRGAPLTTV